MKNDHTFVICAYGDSAYLEDCIKSLVNQTIKSKIILYTSTPSEYIDNLCLKYNIPIYTARGGGIGIDWNQALSFVETPLATIAHQDDVYFPSFTEEVLRKMEMDTLISYTDYSEIKGDQVISKNTNLIIKEMMLKTMALFPKWKWWRNRILAFGNPICCPAVTYNLKKLVDFRFDEEMKVSLDWYAWYIIGKESGKFTYIHKVLMSHRIHEESETTVNIENSTRTNEDLKMFQLFWPNPIAQFLMRFYSKSQDSNQ